MHALGFEEIWFVNGERLGKLFTVASDFSKIEFSLLLVVPSTTFFIIIPVSIAFQGLSISQLNSLLIVIFGIQSFFSQKFILDGIKLFAKILILIVLGGAVVQEIIKIV